MESYQETHSPEQIERDIERTRSQMAGTLGDIQRSLSPGQLVDQALGYIDEKSGQIGSNLINTIKENPIPATLVGVGLAWLATAGWNNGGSANLSPGQRQSQHGRTTRPLRSQYAGAVGYGSRSSLSSSEYDEYGYGSATSPDYSLGEKAFTERRLGHERRANGNAGMGGMTWSGTERRHGERRVSQTQGRSMGQRMGESLGQGQGTMSQAQGAMSQAADTVKQKASETAEQVRGAMGQVHEKASELTGEARQKAVEMGHQVQDRTRQLMNEQPLVIGALGIAIGAALGAMLPRTRQEDEWMGETRDELLHQADVTGGEVLREARYQVRAGMESLESSGTASGTGQSGQTGMGRTESPTASTGASSSLHQAGQHGSTGGLGDLGGSSGVGMRSTGGATGSTLGGTGMGSTSTTRETSTSRPATPGSTDLSQEGGTVIPTENRETRGEPKRP